MKGKKESNNNKKDLFDPFPKKNNVTHLREIKGVYHWNISPNCKDVELG